MASSTIPAAKIIYGVISWSSQTITGGTEYYTDLPNSTITENTIASQMIPGINYKLVLMTPAVLSTIGSYIFWIKPDQWYNSNSINTLMVRARSLTGSNLTIAPGTMVLAIPQSLIKG